LVVGIMLVAILYLFAKTVPDRKPVVSQPTAAENIISTDSILISAKKQITPAQSTRLNELEHSVVRGDVKDQQIMVYHQLAHFWLDTGRIFEPYAWYEAESARLENSEKSLTFAAHLFLENLRGENNLALRSWKALQAKDLFERSLKINPDNDSSIVGLGACYIFGNISTTPMEGIQKILGIVTKDSTNIFAHEVLGQGAMMTGQYDKAIDRFQAVYRLSKNNSPMQITACWIIAEAFEKQSDPAAAISWYEKSLPLLKNEEVKAEVKKRIDELSTGFSENKQNN
jgi:tetratricopeptide (TPR) repeat protein